MQGILKFFLSNVWRGTAHSAWWTEHKQTRASIVLGAVVSRRAHEECRLSLCTSMRPARSIFSVTLSRTLVVSARIEVAAVAAAVPAVWCTALLALHLSNKIPTFGSAGPAEASTRKRSYLCICVWTRRSRTTNKKASGAHCRRSAPLLFSAG